MYHEKPYPICTLDVVIRGGKPNEDDLIDHILQNQPPTTIPLNEFVREYESSPWTELLLVDSNPEHVKNINFGPSRTLNINSSLSLKQE